MKLTTTEEYGLRCLLQVARAAPPASDQLVSIRDVAEAEGLSPDYVAKLLGMLRKAELITSTRGATGGYALAREAATISAAQALHAFDTPLFGESFCDSHAGKRDCCVHKASSCSLTSLWEAVDTALDEVLGRVTLADLLRDNAARGLRPTEPLEPARQGGTHG